MPYSLRSFWKDGAYAPEQGDEHAVISLMMYDIESLNISSRYWGGECENLLSFLP